MKLRRRDTLGAGGRRGAIMRSQLHRAGPIFAISRPIVLISYAQLAADLLHRPRAGMAPARWFGRFERLGASCYLCLGFDGVELDRMVALSERLSLEYEIDRARSVAPTLP